MSPAEWEPTERVGCPLCDATFTVLKCQAPEEEAKDDES